MALERIKDEALRKRIIKSFNYSPAERSKLRFLDTTLIGPYGKIKLSGGKERYSTIAGIEKQIDELKTSPGTLRYATYVNGRLTFRTCRAIIVGLKKEPVRTKININGKAMDAAKALKMIFGGCMGDDD